MSKLKVYVARAMTGRVKEEVVKDAIADKEYLEKAGFEVLDPVTSENVEPTKQILLSSRKAMEEYWPRDKQMIRDAHIIFIMSPHVASMGVIREYGYARYSLWKKVITIFPEGQLPIKSSVAFFEDDHVTDSLIDAVGEAYRTHGTFWKRTKWRLALLNRCLFRWIGHQIGEWK